MQPKSEYGKVGTASLSPAPLSLCHDLRRDVNWAGGHWELEGTVSAGERPSARARRRGHREIVSSTNRRRSMLLRYGSHWRTSPVLATAPPQPAQPNPGILCVAC